MVSNPVAVASSTTLWATASRSWSIPPRPKPGRKPKKDAQAVQPIPDREVNEIHEVDSKGRRVQNRAAQRAFRERKQSQLADLQARVQAYELGEGERNVALQNIAKRLKGENEELKAENAKLKEELEQMKRNDYNESKKRNRAPCPSDSWSLNSKRPRTGIESPLLTPPLPYMSSPSSLASSMASSPEPSVFAMHFPPQTRAPTPTIFPAPTALFPSGKPISFEPGTIPSASGAGFDIMDCGFCSDDTPCVCRELVACRELGLNSSVGGAPMHMKLESAAPTPIPDDSISSILDNLPAYQPPVPLRRRLNPSATNSIFPVTPAPTQAQAVCSGDPANCLACRDDPFGKAFCTALGDSVCRLPSCANCPSHSSSTQASPSQSTISLSSPGSSPNALGITHSPSTMPCSEAWRQLKQHPAIGFADLSLLAEVVARRSKCTGPQVVISPALGSVTPERVSPGPNAGTNDDPVLLTDPHAIYKENQQHRDYTVNLVPQDVLMRCGRQRVMEVQTDAVRDALRLLDARFSGSS